MQKILSGLVAEKFTPKMQRSDDDPAVFTITPLNGMDAMEMCAETTPSSVMRVAIKYGLTDWENCKNKNGEIVEFNVANFGQLLPQTLSEIADKIIEITDLGEDEKKTSELH